MLNQIQPLSQLNKNPSIVWSLLDALFPPFCCNCGILGYELCPDCIKQIKVLRQKDICPACGNITNGETTCTDCKNKILYYDQLRSWGEYSGALRKVIQKIKFDHGIGLIRYFTETSIEFIKSWNIEIDHIVPVPLYKTRYHSRGYNQALLIAKPISKILQIPFKPQTISRKKETISQVGLNSLEREINVLDAFEANFDENQNKSVLVIDDIATTGSTLNECAKALKNAGARKVYCFTLARTLFSKNHLNEQEEK